MSKENEESEVFEGEIVQTLKIQTAEKKSLAEKRHEYEEILEAVRDFEIEDEDDYEFLATKLKEIKACNAEIEKRRKEVTQPLNAAIKAFSNWYKPSTDVLDESEVIIKKKLGEYTLKRRLADEARAKEIAAAAREGDFDKAHKASQALVGEVRVQGVAVRDTWQYDLENLDEVPREFLTLDHSAVKLYIKAAGKDDPKPIPGIKFTRGTQVIARK